MNYDRRVTFIYPQPVIEDPTFNANITQLGPDEALTIFGDAKQRPFVVRLPVSVPVQSGYVQLDSGVNLRITAVTQLRQRTTLYGVEYHGRI